MHLRTHGLYTYLRLRKGSKKNQSTQGVSNKTTRTTTVTNFSKRYQNAHEIGIQVTNCRQIEFYWHSAKILMKLVGLGGLTCIL